MKKRLYLALLVTLATACVLTGCNGCNTDNTVEETTEITSEETETSEVEDTTEVNAEEVEETVSEEPEEVEEPEFVPYTATINYTANLRSGPGTDYEKVGLIVEGAEVTVLEELDDWSRILYEDTEVYVMSQYIDKTETEADTSEAEDATEETNESSSETALEETEETPAYTVTDMEKTMYVQKSVNVRSGPGTGYDKLGALNTNDEVKVTGQADSGWYRIEYKGSVGFVSNNYLGDSKVTVTTTPATPNNSGETGSNTTTPSVDTTGVTTRTVNGSTRYAFRTTANGTPIYDGIDWQWPQYIVDVINACCAPGMTDYEKATAIHNWLVTNISYDYSYSSYTTYSTLNTKMAICNGYANTYQSLCCASGISVSVVCGERDGYKHAWNYIYIGETKYFTDVTNNRGIYTNIITTQDATGTLMEVYDSNGKTQSRWYITGEYWNGYLDAL